MLGCDTPVDKSQIPLLHKSGSKITPRRCMRSQECCTGYPTGQSNIIPGWVESSRIIGVHILYLNLKHEDLRIPTVVVTTSSFHRCCADGGFN